MTLKNTSTSDSDSEIEIISSKNQKQDLINTLTSSPSSFHSNSNSNQINQPIQTNSHSNNRSTSILIESSDEEKTEFNNKSPIDTSNPIHFNSLNQNLNFNKSHSNLQISRKDDKGKSKVIELSDTDEDLNPSHHHSHINHHHHDELPTPDDLFSQDSSLIQPTSVSQPLPSFQSTSNFNLRVKSKRKSKSDDSKKRTKQIEKSNQREQVRIEREVKRATKAKEKHEAKEMREVNKLIGRQEAIVEIRLKVPSSILQIKSHPLTKSIEIFKTRIINEGNETKMSNPILDDEEEDGLIRWIRICKKEWNEVLNCFEPCLSKEVLEKSVLLIWNAQEIDDWIHEGNGEFLRRAKSIREERPMDQIFIVIYGLENLMKTIKNHQNSKMKDQIGSELRGEEDQIGWESNHQQKKKKPIGPKNSMDQILREIEMIKILTKCFIIKVEDTNQLSNWLWELTFEIAVRPYKAKKQKLKADLNLEIEGNKGKDLEDTYLKMLTCLSRVTENEAKGILENFPTLNRLYSSWDSFMAKGDLSGAEGMLIGCKKANSSKSIGKITSKKIFDVLYASKDGDTCIHNT